MPEAPVREGYTFGGWYKEAECINEWDFDADTLPEKQIGPPDPYVHSKYEEGTVIYQETVLYAKWIPD